MTEPSHVDNRTWDPGLVEYLGQQMVTVESGLASPKLAHAFQNFHHHRTLVHQAVIRALDDLYRASIPSQIPFHPSYSVFRDLLVLVAIPYLHLVRVGGIRETQRLIVVIQDLQQVIMGSVGRLGV